MAAEPRADPGDAPRQEAGIRRSVQFVLRGGLALSVALLAIGFVMTVASGDRTASGVRLFDLGGHAAGQTLMAVGVLVLAVTPFFRVVALIVLWARERDLRFVAVAVVVLGVLVASALVGHG